MKRFITRVAIGSAAVGGLLLASAAPAAAHPHRVSVAHQGAGQELANGALHGRYSSTGLTCGGDSASYGLETAHHGPDSGTAGRADGCYQLDSMPPGSDVANPVIR